MDQQVSPGADSAPADANIAVMTTGNTSNFNSVSQAARALTQARHRRPETSSADPRSEAGTGPTGGPRESGELAAEGEPSKHSTTAQAEDDAAPPDPRVKPGEEVRGETESADPAATELPPIEPPRSWTKDDKELFASLPRETQERVAERERSRESDFLRRQNEAADKLKGLTAKEQAVEQARQQYESALPILLSNLQSALPGEFSDIRTMADVQRMASEDWPRYVQWDAQQKHVVAVQQELQAAQVRQAQEQTQRWVEFAKREDDLFIDKVPEFADRAKAAKTQDAAAAMLKDIGFTEDDLGRMWSGQMVLSLRDHRTQLLILDGIRYREAQQKAKQVVAKSVPPVQRPGVSQPRGAAADAQVQSLNQRLEKSGSLKDAAALIAARRKAAR